jgi:hypothetical membrane protein
MTIQRRWQAIGAIVAQAVFVAGWLVGGAIEGDGYSPMRHDISDLAALTAHHATLARLTLLVSGVLTIVFALDLLRRVLDSTLAGVLVALSLPGWDGFSDAFFRLDCRAADAGCSAADSAHSWHGTIHIVSFFVAAIATIAAPFVLARRMRVLTGWQDLVTRTRVFGVVVIVVLVVTGATVGTSVQGLTQRVAAVIVVSGLAALAWQVHRRAGQPDDESATMTA